MDSYSIDRRCWISGNKWWDYEAVVVTLPHLSQALHMAQSDPHLETQGALNHRQLAQHRRVSFSTVFSVAVEQDSDHTSDCGMDKGSRTLPSVSREHRVWLTPL